MISKEDEQRVLKFAQEYRNRAEKVSKYKDELYELNNKITYELKELENARESELKFLDELRDKYDSTPDVVVQLIQKIVMSN